MAWEGSINADAAQIFVNGFAPGITETLRRRLPLLELFNRDTSLVQDMPGEDYFRIAYMAPVDVAMSPRTEVGNVVHPGGFSTTAAYTGKQEIMGSIGWTQRQIDNYSQRGVDGLTHFLGTLADSFRKGALWTFQAIMMGDGTGCVGRVASYSTGYITLDNTGLDFGIDYEASIEVGMLLDVFTVAGVANGNNWTIKARNVVVTSVNRVTHAVGVAVRVDSAGTALADPLSVLGTSGNVPADGDFVFIHGAVNLTGLTATSAAGDVVTFIAGGLSASGNQLIYTPNSYLVPPGLRAFVDDAQSAAHQFDAGTGYYNGSYGPAAFQGLTRSTTPQYLAKIWRPADRGASDNSAAYATSWPDIQLVLEWAFEQSAAPDPAKLRFMASPRTVDWMGRVSASATNTMRVMSGDEQTIGYAVSDYLLGPDGKKYPVHRIPLMPSGVIWGVNFEDIYRYDIHPWGNVSYNPGSGMQFASPGSRNLTFEQWWRWYGQWFAKRNDRHVAITGIDLTYT